MNARIAITVVVLLAALPAVRADESPSASDPRAIAIADAVMQRMGGRAAWDDARILTWRFFGRRLHVWNKQTGDVRIEGVDRDDGEPYVILMNLTSGEGRAWRGGEEVTDPAALAEMLDHGEALWINDSYWMFMPYKLRDPGVTLRYLGHGTMADGRGAEVLALTFDEVGRTPQNKYHVYVADDSGLVEQWDYFENAEDDEPALSTPWHDWKRYGDLLLSANRGERSHTGIAVLESVPPTVFTSPEPVDFAALGVDTE